MREISVSLVLCIVVFFVFSFGFLLFINLSDETSTSNEQPTKTDTLQTKDAATITLEYLSSQPDWNPTLETEWMKRIEDNSTQLDELDLNVKKQEIAFSGADGLDVEYVFVTYESEFAPEYCPENSRYIVESPTFESGFGKLSCPPYSPSQYNEFLILSGDTGEVLHKYKLKEGYTLLQDTKHAVHGEISVKRGFAHSIKLIVSKFESDDLWENLKDQQQFDLNLQTGEVSVE